ASCSAQMSSLIKVVFDRQALTHPISAGRMRAPTRVRIAGARPSGPCSSIADARGATRSGCLPPSRGGSRRCAAAVALPVRSSQAMTHADSRMRPLALALVAALTLSLLTFLPSTAARAATLSTDFSEHPAGAPPADWTSRWAPAWYVVEDNPSRLVQAPNQPARTLITWDAVGDLTGQDVEIATVVQVPADNAAPANGARFLLHLNATGAEGSETSYFLDQTGNNLRQIGR